MPKSFSRIETCFGLRSAQPRANEATVVTASPRAAASAATSVSVMLSPVCPLSCRLHPSPAPHTRIEIPRRCRPKRSRLSLDGRPLASRPLVMPGMMVIDDELVSTSATRHPLRPRRGRRSSAAVGDRTLRSCRPGHRARRPRRGRPVHGRRRRPDEPRRRPHRERVEPGLHRHDARELQARLQAIRAHRLRRGAVRSRVRRRRLPVGHGDRHAGDAHERQHGAVAVPSADPGCDRGRLAPRVRRAPPHVPAEDAHRRMAGHDEPHRTASRQRRRRRTHQGRAVRRRLVAHQRPEDLHHLRRARPRREHRAPGAGPHARLVTGHQGDLDVPRPQVPGRARRFAR